MGDNLFVKWENRYAVGIRVIDEQHKQLINLTDALFESCRQGEGFAREHFGEVLSAAVDYVAFHFSTEEQIMIRVNYPEYPAHKQEHEGFVKKVLEDKKRFEKGQSFVPNGFARYLRDWILSHIAVSDKLIVDHILRLKKEGVLDLPPVLH
ncbi:MAG: bacteriohemerythrin [Spirochaetaceae bacterium]|jgi:hemerythrin|nr:bacteriohemerythrin [Spirochaetaceae bacterium]